MTFLRDAANSRIHTRQPHRLFCRRTTATSHSKINNQKGDSNVYCSSQSLSAPHDPLGGSLLLAATSWAGSTIFNDNFTNAISPLLQMLPGQGAAAAANGQLRYFNQGPLSPFRVGGLSLALPFTGTRWQLDTKATYSLPWCVSGNYSGPPAPNQTCSSGAQAPLLILSFAARHRIRPNRSGRQQLRCISARHRRMVWCQLPLCLV
jgi:hypothetical protein